MAMVFIGVLVALDFDGDFEIKGQAHVVQGEIGICLSSDQAADATVG
jgi:hypothetical protein